MLLPNAPPCPGNSKSQFDTIFSTQGEVVKQSTQRRTLCFIARGRAFYLKTHSGIGWCEIFKNLLLFKMPVLGAGVEWKALHALRAMGINTVTPAGYGRRGLNPACQQSFLLTEDLGESVTLESLLKAWAGSKSLSQKEIRFKRELIRGTAQLVKRLHSHSVIHRDLYLCHIRIRTEDLAHPIQERCPPLYLMDLHRTQVRMFRRARWIVKDLGSLYFPALHIGFSKPDRFRFIREYSQRPLREELLDRRLLWQRVSQRATRTLAIHHTHGPQPASLEPKTPGNSPFR